VNPPKSVWPSADHAIDTHSGSRDFGPTSTKSGLSSSTIDLLFVSIVGHANTATRHALALEIEDLHARRRGRAEPVAVRREDEGVDDVASLERVQVLALVEVPQHRDAVLAPGRGERAVGRDGDGVDVPGVAVVVGLELELLELPHLRDEYWSALIDTRRVRKQGRSEILVIIVVSLG
jgi:hypothetical protein